MLCDDCIRMKKCSRCGEIKTFDQFSKRRESKDGLQSRCKSCVKLYKIERKNKNVAYRLEHPVDENSYKKCSICNEVKPLKMFDKHAGEKDGHISCCKDCRRVMTGHIAMDKNKACASYLGVHITERVLSKFFDHIERMPPTNPGYDFICGKGFKIDVKSSCLWHQKYRSPKWGFHIEKNTIADYFLWLAFDDRDNLNPKHVWLVPGKNVNDKVTISIANIPKSIAKWSQYEKSLDKVVACCHVLKGNDQ